MRVFVTGATGFIGGHVARKLRERGDEVVALVRSPDKADELRELGCDVEFVPARHPVVDIVRFQLLTLALAERRGVNPDHIRTDDPRWKRARAAYD